MAGERLRVEVVAKVRAGRSDASTVHLMEIWERLAERHDVRLWVPGPPADPSVTKLPVNYLPRVGGRRRSSYIRFARAIAFETALFGRLLVASLRQTPDAIYLRETMTLAPALLSRLLSIPLLVEINGASLEEEPSSPGWVRKLMAQVLRFSARSARLLLPVTESLASYAAAAYGIGRERISVIGNGADTARFRPEGEAPAKLELGLSAEFEYVLWSGSSRPWEDIETLLKASAQVICARPGVMLLILTRSRHEPLVKMAAELGIAGRVMFRSAEHSQVHRYLAAARVCVAPFTASERNRLAGLSPLKVFEYLAAGRPIVATRFPDLEFVAQIGAGVLCEPGDAASMAGRLLELLELPEAQYAEMSARARAYAEANGSWEARAGQVEEALRLAASPRRRARGQRQ